MQALSGGALATDRRRWSATRTAWLTPEPVVERLQLDDSSWVDISARSRATRSADEVHDDVLCERALGTGARSGTNGGSTSRG